jgi:hypothetical protein
MSTVNKLGRVLKLREHRSLIAQQWVQNQRQAVQQAESFLLQQEAELQRRIETLLQSERSAAKLLKDGGSGVRFEDFMAHARLVRDRIQAQRTDVQAARQSVEEAQARLEQAQAAHALARKAEEKTRHFQGNARSLLRLHQNLQEAEQLEEVCELQHQPVKAAWPGSFQELA